MLSLPRNGLKFIGRHASTTYALSILLGLALPALASSLRPFIPISIFTFIVMQFARASLPGLKRVFSQPWRLLLALVLTTAIPPILGVLMLMIPTIRALDPGIQLGIALMAAAPPLMASPVFAALLGLENSLSLTILVLGMVVTPLVSPPIATFLSGGDVPISALDLSIRLAIFIGGGMITGLIVRRLAGQARIASVKEELDGIGVMMFFLFAIAAMDGVLDKMFTAPAEIALMLSLSFGIAIANFGVGFAVLRGFGFNDQFSVAMSISLRNMGLLMAPILSLVPKSTFLYFALAQVPVYVAPMILKATKRWLEPKP